MIGMADIICGFSTVVCLINVDIMLVGRREGSFMMNITMLSVLFQIGHNIYHQYRRSVVLHLCRS